MASGRVQPTRPEPRPPLPWGQIIKWAAIVVAIIAVIGCIALWWLWRQDVAAFNAEIASLKANHAAVVQELRNEIGRLNEDKANLEHELANCQNTVEGLKQRVDWLERELDFCLGEMKQPERLQTLLPGLLRDNTTTVLVIDDSGSMIGLTPTVQEALAAMRADPAENSRLAMFRFGDDVQMEFNFTDPSLAPWDAAIGTINADLGGTNLDLALLEAYDTIKDEENPNKRIILVTDGYGGGQGPLDPATLVPFQVDGIPVDTVSFGPLVNHRFMEWLADQTNGIYQAAH